TVRLIGVEAGGLGLDTTAHSASISAGEPGILHGMRSFVLQDGDGQIRGTHSISAGLDYPGVGPEHSALRDSGRATYVAANDDDAVDAFRLLCETEGIIPALEPSHAIGYLTRHAADFKPDELALVILSGRGDKDIHSYMKATGADPAQFLA